MPAKVFLGIDLGTSVLKVCAFDARGGESLARASRRLKIQSFPDGGKEIQLSVLERAFASAVRETRETLGERWNDIAGIGLASQAGSSILVDWLSGTPRTPMILWNDGRCQQEMAELVRDLPPEACRKTLCNDFPPMGLARLMWLKKRYPKLFNESSLHVGAGEYLYFHLTGVWLQDAGNALQIGSYNANEGNLFGDLLNRAEVSLQFVAPLRKGHETAPISSEAAGRWKLPEGIPVAGPYFDQEAAFLSAVGADRNPLQLSLGTAWVGNFVLSDEYDGTSPTQLVVPSPTGEGRLVVQPLLTGNPTWEWGLRTFMGKTPTRALEKANALLKERWTPPSGLVALPWFSQPNPTLDSCYGGGMFVGLNDRTTRRDQFLALAAGMVFEAARVFESLKETGAIDCVVVGGGASKSDYFLGVLAELFSPAPVYCIVDEDLCAARGGVYGFNKNVAKSRLQPIKRETSREAEILRAYKDYNAVFNAYYGSIPTGSAYRMARRPE